MLVFDGLQILRKTAIGLSIMAFGVVCGQKTAPTKAIEQINSEDIIIQTSIEYFTYIKGLNMLTIDEIKYDMDDYYIIDIRRAEDYEKEHITGAINIIIPEIGKAIPKLPKNKPILIVCYSGEWASQVVGVLRLAGFDARALQGGYDEWQNTNKLG